MSFAKHRPDLSNREQCRAAEKYLREQNLLWPVRMTEWPRQDWTDGPQRHASNLLTVYRSRDFLCQVFNEGRHGVVVRLSVCRTAIKGDRWQDGIAWEELQRIKGECGYGNHDAVEVYPAEADTVNVANMRHLWVMAEPLRFKWSAIPSTPPAGQRKEGSE